MDENNVAVFSDFKPEVQEKIKSCVDELEKIFAKKTPNKELVVLLMKESIKLQESTYKRIIEVSDPHYPEILPDLKAIKNSVKILKIVIKTLK